MFNILINGLNAKSGGGKSILTNYVALLNKKHTGNNYYILTPNKNDYVHFQSENVHFVDIKRIYKSNFFIPFVYYFVLPKLINKLEIDCLFNLADIPVRTQVRQVFLFDWPYAVYPESIIWKMMDFKSKIVRKIKLHYFKSLLPFVDLMIAQTDVIKKRLEELYTIGGITVIPNAVTLESMDSKEDYDFNLPDSINLVYLSFYYPHKNFEILLTLGQKIGLLKLNYKIFVTIDNTQHPKAKKFLETLKRLKLDNIIINLGPVEMKYVPSLLSQCDGLLMPTLLETFGLPYIEAMQNNTTILTSDMDFAHAVCKDSAYYFDPLNIDSILHAILSAFDNIDERNKKKKSGIENLSRFYSWNDVLSKYDNLILSGVDNGN